MTLNVLNVDRSRNFDPVELLGGGWKVEEDPRALRPTQIDLSKVALHTRLRPGESDMTGEERLERLKNEVGGSMPLDPDAFVALLSCPDKFPEVWKKKVDGHPPAIFF